MDMPSRSAASGGASRELLSFRVGAQEFCIDIMAVREIRGWTPATALPHAPSYLRGIVNLRGTVLPVLDLANRLGFGTTEITPQHVIIVIQIETRIIGLLVSSVCDILAVTDDMLQPTPDIASGPARAFVQGLLNVQDRMVSLLRTDQLIPIEEMEMA